MAVNCLKLDPCNLYICIYDWLRVLTDRRRNLPQSPRAFAFRYKLTQEVGDPPAPKYHPNGGLLRLIRCAYRVFLTGVLVVFRALQLRRVLPGR